MCPARRPPGPSPLSFRRLFRWLETGPFSFLLNGFQLGLARLYDERPMSYEDVALLDPLFVAN